MEQLSSNSAESKIAEKPVFSVTVEVPMKPWETYETDREDLSYDLRKIDETGGTVYLLGPAIEGVQNKIIQLHEAIGRNIAIEDGYGYGGYTSDDDGSPSYEDIERLLSNGFSEDDDFDIATFPEGNTICVHLYDADVLDFLEEARESATHVRADDPHIADVWVTIKPVYEDVSEEEFQTYISRQYEALKDMHDMHDSASTEARSNLDQAKASGKRLKADEIDDIIRKSNELSAVVEVQEEKISKIELRHGAWLQYKVDATELVEEER